MVTAFFDILCIFWNFAEYVENLTIFSKFWLNCGQIWRNFKKVHKISKNAKSKFSIFLYQTVSSVTVLVKIVWNLDQMIFGWIWRAAAWKYYPTILLPATLMGFSWRLENNDSRQKYIDFQEKNFVSCQRATFENRMQSHRSNWCKQTAAKSSLVFLLCCSTFSQIRATHNRIWERCALFESQTWYQCYFMWDYKRADIPKEAQKRSCEDNIIIPQKVCTIQTANSVPVLFYI